MEPSVSIKPFDALTPHDLYRILQLRQDVFIVEQTCIFRDLDDNDFRATHIFADTRGGGALAGYARVFGPGIMYDEASIGRVATSRDERRTGLGRVIVRAAIAYLDEHHPGPIRIGAQRYIERFYGGFGFAPDGDPYVEDGIPHIHMVRPRQA